MRVDKEVGPILSSTLGAKYDTLRRAELQGVKQLFTGPFYCLQLLNRS